MKCKWARVSSAKHGGTKSGSTPSWKFTWRPTEELTFLKCEKYTKPSSLALLILAPCLVFLLIPADLDPGYLWRRWSLHLPEQLRFHVLYLGTLLGYSISSSLASSLYSIIFSILAWTPHGQRIFFQRPLQLRETDLPKIMQQISDEALNCLKINPANAVVPRSII